MSYLWLISENSNKVLSALQDLERLRYFEQLTVGTLLYNVICSKVHFNE